MSVGDLSGIHQTTAGKIIARVSAAIASKYRNHIRFPVTHEQVLKTQSRFFRIAKFPTCVGAVDGTHVRIQSPGGDNSELFRNRKGYFSINVQGVCNADLFFTDIVARWHGSAHDSTIFNHSRIKSEFERGSRPKQVLVADSGYACNSYMMTPLLTTDNNASRLYNESQIRTRNTVERTFGVWKRRFPVLSTMMRTKLETIQDVIVATAVLHNICRKNSDDLPGLTREQMIRYRRSMQCIPDIQPSNLNSAVRNHIIYNHFATL